VLIVVSDIYYYYTIYWFYVSSTFCFSKISIFSGLSLYLPCLGVGVAASASVSPCSQLSLPRPRLNSSVSKKCLDYITAFYQLHQCDAYILQKLTILLL